MTSTSDQEGFCQRCGCANGVHRFGQCRGKNKGGRCDFEWFPPDSSLEKRHRFPCASMLRKHDGWDVAEATI
ncbi:hypothetical protein HZ326_15238, partial [Fusarium oxysporum f. sp. albedinis]